MPARRTDIRRGPADSRMPRCAKLRDAQSPSSQPNHQQQQEVGIDVDAAKHDLGDARNLAVPDGLNDTVSVADANHLVGPAW